MLFEYIKHIIGREGFKKGEYGGGGRRPTSTTPWLRTPHEFDTGFYRTIIKI